MLLLLPFVSCFISVFSKLFLSQIMTFTFCAFNCPLHPITGAQGGRGGSEQTAHGLECLMRTLNWEHDSLSMTALFGTQSGACSVKITTGLPSERAGKYLI